MNVLSLFDGISCGQVALQRAGIPVENYYASEIEKSAITVTQSNFPNTIQLGDVREINPANLPQIDLMCFGSPCQNFSFSGRMKGMSSKDGAKLTSLSDYLKYKEQGVQFEGQSYLFWEAIRILQEVKPKYFLMENVVMKKEWEDIISNTLGVKPIVINASLVSAQNRVRNYWTNIPNIDQPEDLKIGLNDILESVELNNPAAVRGRNVPINKGTIVGRRVNEKGCREDYNYDIPVIQCLEVRATNRNKSNCLTTVDKDNVLTTLPIGRHVDAFGKYTGTPLPFRYYTRTEYERLQTLPDGYTKSIAETKAKKCIGNGWCVDVIAHIFKHLPQNIGKEAI